MPKKYYIITFGCQMNQADSERIAFVLENIGYKKAAKIERADLIIVNMCSVRQSAVDRVYGLNTKFSRLRKIKKIKIALTGCILPNDKEKFKNKFDLIFSIKDLPNLPNLLNKKFNNKKIKHYNSYLSIYQLHSSLFSAYIPIMTGCNNFCTYCVVPYTRGPEVSRPSKEILDEIKKLIKNGYKEITLLGQNVNSYKAKISFPQLLQRINDIPGKFWIRFITSHPKDLSDELINTMVKCHKICGHIHLPAQSGDNKILKKMNRNYTIEHYKKLIYKIRKEFTKAKKNISISTDIIVGFPGETKKQFENTVKLMREIKFDMAYIAQYSPRYGTPAMKFANNISKIEKKQREKFLNKILSKTALENNKKYINKILEVLIENKKNNYYFGKTKTFKNVKILPNKKYNVKIGEFYWIKISKVGPWGLEANFIEPINQKK